MQPLLRRAAALSVLASLLVLAPSVYMLAVYDRVVNSRNPHTLLMLTVLVLGVYAVMETLDWARSQLLHQAGEAWAARLRTRVFEAMFRVNLRRQASITAQPMSDLRAVADFFSAPVLTALLELPVSLVFLVILFAMHPWLGWAAITGALLQAGLTALNQRSTQATLLQAQREAGEAHRWAQSAFRCAQVIQALGMAAPIQSRWVAQQRSWLGWQAQASEVNGTYQAASRGVQNIVGSLLLGLGAWLVLRNELEGGAGWMIVASVLGGRVLAPLVQVIAQWRAVVAATQAWQRLGQLLTQLPARLPTMALPAPQGRLAVENLYAVAPGATAPILKGLSFALPPGEVLAVVGPSGAGKSTLARVLMGVWPPASGKVRLDGADLSNWDPAQLGPHLGYLPQGVALFDGTLADNIARFGEGDMAAVEAAARAVGLHEAITALPLGYASPVGRDGTALSGGMRQRVGLARALYGQPAFVVLDEPNASLDEAGDRALSQAIRQMKAQGTSFVVMTHRSSVLSVADQLLVLQEGQARAFGPRDEVLAQLAQAAAAPPKGPASARPPGARLKTVEAA